MLQGSSVPIVRERDQAEARAERCSGQVNKWVPYRQMPFDKKGRCNNRTYIRLYAFVTSVVRATIPPHFRCTVEQRTGTRIISLCHTLTSWLTIKRSIHYYPSWITSQGTIK